MSTDLPISSMNNLRPDASDVEAERGSGYRSSPLRDEQIAEDDLQDYMATQPEHGETFEMAPQPSEEAIQRDEIENGPGGKEYLE